MGFDVTTTTAVSDGVMTAFSSYDNRIYAYGKGPTEISLSAPSVGVTTASPITITGSVMDISAGTKQEAQAANFPNGVPAVSDDSMAAWMEYVYMQQQKPTNATGVPITISVIDDNGNYRQIGSTTSDASGTFALTWTPDIHGDYIVIASFAGSESYYPSSAETHFTASPVTSSATPNTGPIASATDQYFLPAVAAIIAVIVVVGAILALLLLRRKP
jgi:hypothetical protein